MHHLEKHKKWGKLMIAACLLWLFISYLAPGMTRLPLLNDMHRLVENRNINTGGLFYTECDETSLAQ